MAIYYIMKWVQVGPLTKIIEAQVKVLFGIHYLSLLPLRIIIIDNGHQFSDFKLTEFCKDLGVIHCFTTTGHPQANREAEVTNCTLLQGLKPQLD